MLLADENVFKILVVEDDREANRSVSSFLNGSGYEAVSTLDAESAYDEMYKKAISLAAVSLQALHTQSKTLS